MFLHLPLTVLFLLGSGQSIQQSSTRLKPVRDVSSTTCTDNPGLNCADIITSSVKVCKDMEFGAPTLCPRSCGFCSEGTSPRPTDQSRTSPRPTDQSGTSPRPTDQLAVTTTIYSYRITSNVTCTDIPPSMGKCSEMDNLLHICTTQPDNALKYCPRYCNICHPEPPCKDSDLVDCEEMDKNEQICSKLRDDPKTKHFCPKLCGLCGVSTTVRPTTTTITTTPTTTPEPTTTVNPFCDPSYRTLSNTNGSAVSTVSPDSRELKLKRTFEEHDLNLDGVVTKAEFLQMWMEMDTDKDGSVSEKEYASSSLSMAPEIFLFKDENNDCLISLTEIPRIFLYFDSLIVDGLLEEQEFMMEHLRIYDYIYHGIV